MPYLLERKSDGQDPQGNDLDVDASFRTKEAWVAAFTAEAYPNLHPFKTNTPANGKVTFSTDGNATEEERGYFELDPNINDAVGDDKKNQMRLLRSIALLAGGTKVGSSIRVRVNAAIATVWAVTANEALGEGT